MPDSCLTWDTCSPLQSFLSLLASLTPGQASVPKQLKETALLPPPPAPSMCILFLHHLYNLAGTPHPLDEHGSTLHTQKSTSLGGYRDKTNLLILWGPTPLPGTLFLGSFKAFGASL